MKTKPSLASVGMNNDLVEQKLQLLLEGLPKRIPDELRVLLDSLADHIVGRIVVADDAAAVPTNSPFDITVVTDFDVDAYDKVLAAVRAFKADIAHC
ncbi:hypothetical protein [Enterobacter kobei]|uniref:hypothetical protein n=1 Tax=Enterobacter kobei TaxID=208224 RepID=UPI002A83AEBF|nr:hypothetical protein [Enterobacter kobei]